MDAKKLAVLAIVALVLFFVIIEPKQAADAVSTVGGLLEDGANAIVTFVTELFA